MIEEYINSKNIRQGELIFILHTKKPMKTGWYRKVSENILGNKNLYVFEKSIHPKFNENDISLEASRRTRGVFHMNEAILKNDKSYGNQYIILARATGVSAGYIMKDEYCIRECVERLEELQDIIITTDGLKVLRELNVLYDGSGIYDKYIKAINEGLSTYK